MSSFLQRPIVKVACKAAEKFLVKFLKLTPIYVVVAVGAIGTFTANALRIATISSIGLQVGSSAAQYFHDYWGELFFITWMLIYLAALFLAPKLAQKLSRIRKKHHFSPSGEDFSCHQKFTTSAYNVDSSQRKKNSD